jgi:RNA polymerase sigma-70 factor (ECF subfamily)
MDGAARDAEWRQWLDQHAPKILFFARQKARSAADAEDLMQEAIIEAAQRNGNGGPPPPGLVFATLYRRAIDLARRENRRNARELVVSNSSTEEWFDTGVEDHERATLIQETMQKLPQNYREVVALKIWGELTFIEIAEVIGIPANTAASRYRYGLQELRKLAKGVFT